MKWISVKDRLPEATKDSYTDTDSCDVLATDGSEIMIAYYTRWIAHDIIEKQTWHDLEDNELEIITHWMPLPELPFATTD